MEYVLINRNYLTRIDVETIRVSSDIFKVQTPEKRESIINAERLPDSKSTSLVKKLYIESFKMESMKSLTLSPYEMEALKKEIISQGLTLLPTSEYELLRVKEKNIFFVLYTTGKMVFQESQTMEELLDAILSREECMIIGTDEAGKGEWYGPLVVAGVALTPEETVKLRKMGVGDSKDLSSFRIYEVGTFIVASPITREVRVVLPSEYNEMYENFRKEKKTLNDILTVLHAGIIQNLLEKMRPEKARVFVDRFDVREKVSSMLEHYSVDITEKPGGESEAAVAAASVLAKLTFEEEVKNLNKLYRLDLQKTDPEAVSAQVLPHVGKLHFKNVKKVISSAYLHKP